jgi:hypothetical protein
VNPVVIPIKVERKLRSKLKGRIALLDDVEMVIEGRDLVDLGQGHFHFRGQGDQMRRGQLSVAVLDFVQVLD